jgi:hypothetical protein
MSYKVNVVIEKDEHGYHDLHPKKLSNYSSSTDFN